MGVQKLMARMVAGSIVIDNIVLGGSARAPETKRSKGPESAPVGFGAGGVATQGKTTTIVSASDVAAALGFGGLGRQQYLLGRAVFCDDIDAELFVLVKKELNRLAARAHRVLSDEIALGITESVLFELVWRPACKSCSGSGVRVVQGLYQGCDACGGSGAGQLAVRERALIAKIPKSTFHRDYLSLSNELIATLEGWLAQVAVHLHHQFSEAA